MHTDQCRFCEEEDTFIHLLDECPVFYTMRQELLHGEPIINTTGWKHQFSLMTKREINSIIETKPWPAGAQNGKNFSNADKQKLLPCTLNKTTQAGKQIIQI